jgi:hypothetical protein
MYNLSQRDTPLPSSAGFSTFSSSVASQPSSGLALLSLNRSEEEVAFENTLKAETTIIPPELLPVSPSS